MAVLVIMSLIMCFINCLMCHYLEANKGSKDFFEGDIKRYIDPNMQMSALRNATYRWKKGIVPYTFNELYPHPQRAKVERIMKTFHSKTCVKFVPWSNETDYIEISNVNDQCFSDVGRSGRKQILSLSEGCMDKNTVLHELMHALGFFHEQSRYDRDDYIEIHHGAIIAAGHNPDNFKKMSKSDTTHYSTIYDFNSVMHYPAFMNGVEVMKPKFLGVKIKAKGLSKIDIWEINEHYKCKHYESAESAETFPPFVVPPVQHQAPITRCEPLKFYCGHELTIMNYQHVNNNATLYRCNEKHEGVAHFKCFGSCKQAVDGARCECGPTNNKKTYCGYQLKLFRFNMDGLDDNQPYRCENSTLVKWDSKCDHFCQYGKCIDKITHICYDGNTYCSWRLTLSGLQGLGGTESANELYRCNGTVSANHVETCKILCLESGDAHCSTDRRQLAIPTK